MPAPPRPIRVLIVDDSALIRQILSELLSSEPGIEVVGTAQHPLIARRMIKELDPDVLTLDVEMPEMDGLSFLAKLMALRPMPVVMVSSLTDAGAQSTLQALELGAVDFVCKPAVDLRHGMGALRDELVQKVRAAAAARGRLGLRPATAQRTIRPAASSGSSEQVIAIGASTGGVEALRELICALPPDGPGVLVTQHMPAKFTMSFAARLDGMAAVTVREAIDGVRLLPGHVQIAPGNRHLELARSGADFRCSVTDGPSVSGHRPSVDVLFESVARSAGNKAVGVILTGMGRDGAAGLLAMREAGAFTIGQDEASCLIYGMPKAAHDIGASQVELPLHRIPGEVLDHCNAVGRALRI